MSRHTFWTLLLAAVAMFLTLEAAGAQEETAWERLVRENPSVTDEGVTPRLERQILQRLTPEQAEWFAAGKDPSTILLADGRDLGTALTEVLGAPGGVYHAVDACKLNGPGVPAGNLFPAGDTTITVRGTCGIPPEAIGLIVNIKMFGPTEAGRVSVFPAEGGVFGPGFLNFRGAWPSNNSVVVELCEGTCPTGDLVVRMSNVVAPQAVLLHTLGYFAPEGDADPANELNTSVELVGTTLEVTDSGGTRSVDLGSLVDDADANPANELNASMALAGTQLQVTDAGGTLAAELEILVNDADSDPANELNTSVALVGTELRVADAGGTKTAELGSLDGDPAETAVQGRSSLNIVGTGFCTDWTSLYLVLPGQRLVVEWIAAESAIPGGPRDPVDVDVRTWDGSGWVVHPLTRLDNSVIMAGSFFGTQRWVSPVRLYSDGGASFEARMCPNAELTDEFIGALSFSGYLLDLP